MDKRNNMFKFKLRLNHFLCEAKSHVHIDHSYNIINLYSVSMQVQSFTNIWLKSPWHFPNGKRKYLFSRRRIIGVLWVITRLPKTHYEDAEFSLTDTSFIHSFVRSFVRLFVCTLFSFIRSVNIINSFIYSSIRTYICMSIHLSITIFG